MKKTLDFCESIMTKSVFDSIDINEYEGELHLAIDFVADEDKSGATVSARAIGNLDGVNKIGCLFHILKALHVTEQELMHASICYPMYLKEQNDKSKK